MEYGLVALVPGDDSSGEREGRGRGNKRLRSESSSFCQEPFEASIFGEKPLEAFGFGFI